MNEPVAQSEVKLPTDVRYSTRALLIAMAVAAIVVTAATAVLRIAPEDERTAIAAHWCVYLLLLTATAGYVARRRYVVEREAGVVRYVLATHSYLAPKIPAIGRTMFGALLLLTGFSLWTLEGMLITDGKRPVWTQFLSWNAYMAVASTGAGVTYLWWYRNVRMCEEGLVVRHELHPWSGCRRWYWDAAYRDVMVIESQSKVALRVPEEKREEVQTFVDGKIGPVLFRALAQRG